MCGRFTLSSPSETIEALFELAEMPDLRPRYNIAPTQPVAAVVFDNATSARALRLLHWGLVPSWAKDPGIGARMINARCETVAVKPSFRSAFRRRRCLVVADGFYEWKKLERAKQPYYIRLGEGQPFAFAGLWEHWQGQLAGWDGDGGLDSCTIITTEPNELAAPIHNRMPVILRPEDYASWLDPELTEPDAVQSLLRPYAADQMEAYPVSTRVNRAANDEPECIERVE